MSNLWSALLKCARKSATGGRVSVVGVLLLLISVGLLLFLLNGQAMNEAAMLRGMKDEYFTRAKRR